MKTKWGAYGFSYRGLSQRLIKNIPETWPNVSVEQHVLQAGESPPEGGLPLLGGGSLVINHGPDQATFHVPERIDAEALTHPFLAPVAANFAYRRGYETFHAGGFATDRGVWAVAAERDGGKSSLLATLAIAGFPIVTDDLTVVDGDRVFAGPRSIDLRADAAARFPDARELGVIGGRERWRLDPGPVESELPMAGWIFLEWSSELSARRIQPGERVGRLARQRAARGPLRDPAVLLHLAAYPMWLLARPRTWSASGATLEALTTITSG